MILTTHILAAAAIIKTTPYANPFLIFSISFFSHYLLDLLPHWNYLFNSIDEDGKRGRARIVLNPNFLKDMFKVAADTIIGSALLLYLIYPRSLADAYLVLAIISGSVLPDLLQGIYYLGDMKNIKVFKLIQYFHEDVVHWIDGHHINRTVGIATQLLILAVAIFIVSR